MQAEEGIESRWLVVGGARWHSRVSTARVDEAAPPVVVVHGLGVSGRYMVPLMPCLAGEFRTIAPDLPGFGRSDEPREPLGPAALADALAAWMAASGLAEAALLGNSLGCQVIAHLAGRHPERASRVVLVSPTMDPSAPSPVGQVARLLRDVPRE